MSDLTSKILSTPGKELPELIRTTDPIALAQIFASDTDEVADIVLPALDHQSLSRLFVVSDVLHLQRALQAASAASVAHILELIQPKHLGKLLANASNELVERCIELAPNRDTRIKVAQSLPMERRRHWLQILTDQEKSLADLKRVKEGAATSLLDERKRMLSELDHAIQERQELLHHLHSEESTKRAHFESLTEEAQRRLDQLQITIANREAALRERESDLAHRIAEFEEATKRQVQQRIEVKVPEYVAAAVRVLEARESHYRKKAFGWGVHGTVVLILAIAATVFVSLYGYAYGEGLSTLGWQALVFVSFKGLVVLGVLGLWAKHAFTVSNAYMHEAIKRADRAHAINFGKLYLEVYGNTVDRKELLDIFENWNITSESAFAKAAPDSFEPKILEKLIDVLKTTERNRASTG